MSMICNRFVAPRMGPNIGTRAFPWAHAGGTSGATPGRIIIPFVPIRIAMDNTVNRVKNRMYIRIVHFCTILLLFQRIAKALASSPTNIM